ncbi:MFS transporter [Kitasatospora brasiliensis]|uniref:MFS transporter n=1 Tax=Kitasatospora brasiliensis TaxID=3058040 RepID=UPI00292F43D3|nr:MFS transporter [Kitasatospora sp. K002]
MTSTSEPPRGHEREGLWRDADFLRFWSAETLSLFGAQISLLAVPLLAVTTLHATPFQMGLVNAVQFAPFLLFTLIAGVWVDERRRRPILIGANLGRAVIFGLIPIATAMDVMGIGLLAVVVFLGATLTVLFDLAYQSYLPTLVGREHLVEGNGRVEGSRSLAQAGGPGMAGLLVGLVSAAGAVTVNAVTYLVSAVTMMFIRRPEPAPRQAATRGSVLSRIAVGLKVVVRNPYLRAIAGEASVYNLFNQALWAVLVLYLSRQVHLPATAVGVVMAMAGVGAFAGSLVAGWLGRRLGTGRTIMTAMVIGCAAPLVIPAASGGRTLTAVIAGAALFFNGMGVVVCNVQVISLRQAAVPAEVLGRANAGYRFLVTGTAAIGALLGGWLGGLIGLRATMVIGGLGTLAALSFFIGSPILRLRSVSDVVASASEGSDPESSPAPTQPAGERN